MLVVYVLSGYLVFRLGVQRVPRLGLDGHIWSHSNSMKIHPLVVSGLDGYDKIMLNMSVKQDVFLLIFLC